MSLKDKLIEIKEKIMNYDNTSTRDYEFNATFDSHPIGNQDVYRLYYVNYHRIGEYAGRRDDNIGVLAWNSKPFMFPINMSYEDGFKVLSYLTDYIEKREDIKPFSLGSVMTLDNVLNLDRLGFRRVEEENEDNILNLFTVSGRLLLFKNCNLYSKYFEWYSENVTYEEVVDIFSKCGIEFNDIEWSNDKKVLELK